MSASVDIEGLRELRLELETAPERVHDELVKVVKKAGVNIKTDWRKRWTGHASYRALPSAIGFDITDEAGVIELEVGPDQETIQGPLAGFIELEYGTVWSAPNPGGAPALAAEEPALVRHIADAIERSLIR